MNAWSVEQVLALCAAGLVGLGLYGVIVSSDALRRIVAFNVIGGGVFLFFGAIAKRGAAAGFAGDPVPGLGRIDAIRKQDGRWVVVTSKGLIVAR